ncbi:MAG: 5,10-methylenetetrahydrofolate reductase-associated protein [bacterium]|nr:MAG: 5,10-methylenetetrahydrofolate reductase-associated protein [bacterium]
MIITTQKSLKDIIKGAHGAKSVFIVGCGDCSTLCRTGGWRQIDEMKERLAQNGIAVTGSDVVNAACHELDTQRVLRKNKEAVADAEALLAMTCGAGVQAVGDYCKKPVISGCDSLFIGNSKRQMRFYEKCSACGDCVLNMTCGLCPVTRCPKGLLNSPCGGAKGGKCEVDGRNDCVWILIFDRMKSMGRLDDFMEIIEPKDYSISQKPHRLEEPVRPG